MAHFWVGFGGAFARCIVALGRVLVSGYGLHIVGSPPIRLRDHSQFLSMWALVCVRKLGSWVWVGTRLVDGLSMLIKGELLGSKGDLEKLSS